MVGNLFSGAQSFWNDILEGEVAKRWNDGGSADEIAAWLSVRLRKTVSRNAVIGKVGRMRKAGVKLRERAIVAPKVHMARVIRGMERAAKVCGEPKRPPKRAKAPNPPVQSDIVLPTPKKTGFNFGISDLATQKAWQRQGQAALARAEANEPQTGITIFQLTRFTCRAPAGGKGEDMLYCGKRTIEGIKTSYCADCHPRMVTGKVSASDLIRSVRRSAA